MAVTAGRRLLEEGGFRLLEANGIRLLEDFDIEGFFSIVMELNMRTGATVELDVRTGGTIVLMLGR